MKRFFNRSIISLLCISSIMFSPLVSAAEYRDEYTKSSAIQISNDGRFIWSVLADIDQVVVVSTKLGKVVSRLDVGDDPRAISLSDDGMVAFVAVSAENGIRRIDVTNGSEEHFKARVRRDIGLKGLVVTGSEPRSLSVDSNLGVVFVANSSQDTISIISMPENRVIDAVDLANSKCNVGDKDRHFYPVGMALDRDNNVLYVNRFLSFTSETGMQRDDSGKEGVICKLKITGSSSGDVALVPKRAIRLRARETGFPDVNGNDTYAYPNQLGSISLRDGRAYLPNIAASPTGPQTFDTITQSFVNIVNLATGSKKDEAAINLHLAGRDPEQGKLELYFANPIDIAFDTRRGVGRAFVATAGSDIIVELSVGPSGALDFTIDQDTTRYIDLNDPDNWRTSGRAAGKNPIGIVFSRRNGMLYTLNNLSRNISVVDPRSSRVVSSIEIAELPIPGSMEETLLVGAEMFFSSRGYFLSDDLLIGSDRNRLSEKGRQNCASCHAGGFTDGVVWQFATGPRKTISVNGTFNHLDPSDQRIINASAIFDEVEDADFNTRLVSSRGWLESPMPCIDLPPYDQVGMSLVDPDHGLILGDWGVLGFAACVMNQFERPNAGRPQPYVLLPGSDVAVKAHDALVDWQRFAIRTPNGPMTKTQLREAGAPGVGGIPDRILEKGRQLFSESGCVACHSGGKWTSSRKDFESPPAISEIATESGVFGVNPSQFLHRFLVDIGSYALGVPNEGNGVPGYRDIGGEEVDGAGRLALGKDYNGDGMGDGYNVYSILGIWSSQPYYHNGACETLRCVLSDSRHRVMGSGSAAELNARDIKALDMFLRSIDEDTNPF